MRLERFGLRAEAFGMLTALAILAVAAKSDGAPIDDGQAQFRSIYRELIETDTSLLSGSCTAAAERMRARLVSAGYSADATRVIVPAKFPKQGNLVARLAGSDAQVPALLLLAHIDVVDAKAADWKRDPFKLIEEDGYFFARGAIDDKAMAASFVDALIRFRQEGFRPRRTIKLALTCGEETDANFNGVQYLLANDPDTLNAGFALNEGGKGYLDARGVAKTFGVQAGEKIYQDYILTTTSPGGHSSRPGPDNAITRLSQGLVQLGGFRFPAEPNETTRHFFERSAPLYPGQTGTDMRAIGAGTADRAAIARISDADNVWNALMRTTCAATMVEAGHAVNALPQRAQANVNCRILPGHSVAEVQSAIVEQLNDPTIKVMLRDAPGPVTPAPPLTSDVMGPIERIAGEMWPGVPVIPSMSTGATDGRFLLASNIPTYGVSGIFVDPDGNGIHGLDERVRAKSLYDGRTYLYRLIKAYGKQGTQ